MKKQLFANILNLLILIGILFFVPANAGVKDVVFDILSWSGDDVIKIADKNIEIIPGEYWGIKVVLAPQEGLYTSVEVTKGSSVSIDFVFKDGFKNWPNGKYHIMPEYHGAGILEEKYHVKNGTDKVLEGVLVIHPRITAKESSSVIIKSYIEKYKK